ITFSVQAQPVVSFTFDDGVTNDMPGYTFEQWNGMLLNHLDNAGVKAVFFVTSNNKTDTKGKALLASWNDRGHSIGNHTVSHLNYGSKHVTFEQFKHEFLSNDSLIRKYSNYIPLFRFPYLKEGDTKEKVESFRALMKEHHYNNGYVTIDASDWYIDSRLRKKLRENPQADIAGFRKFYLEHLYERAVYYENLSYTITGRHIKHTLLLHHNLAAALFAGDLITMFKEKGWTVVNAKDAFNDPIFKKQPSNIPAGESLIWALAKESGKYEGILRYPAEDSIYEEEKMNALGL
ncbi:MAG TPA: polysaccharide deacetylase family protein, partial [Ohtaekwangia sp.]|uniref:polysaccharide deacetylase family protein n=1 Tax=Ohtaekwangia sp. TaxID=2066019 RepID=UPI002F91CD8A